MNKQIELLEKKIKEEIKLSVAFIYLKDDIKIGFDNFYRQNIAPNVADYWACAIAMHLKDYEILKAKLEVINKLKKTLSKEIAKEKKE